MTRKTKWVNVPGIALTLAAALAAALPGFAEPVLPAPTTGAECTSVTGVVVNSFTSCSAGGGVAQVTLAPFAGVSSSASAAPFMASGGFADLIYDFEVVGGRVGDVVPLLFTANLVTNANSASDGFASITVGTSITFPDPGSTQVVACTNEALCTKSADFSGTFEVSVESGFLNNVNLEAVSGEVSTAGPEKSSASADPLIVIDPSFANAADYSIVLSPGVANAVESAVPEPRYKLLIGVFAGLAWLTRRRT
ncbi:MAG: hypothetical protein ABSE86_30510 [Bryobacteraceae bacterium]|jgi:hypothetical protein